MGKYGVTFDNFSTAAGNAYKTAVSLLADGTGETCEIIELIMTGAGIAAAADRQHTARVVKADPTGNGTGTAFTPEPFDEISNAARIAATVEFSAEPAAVLGTVYPLLWGFNQRGGMRWAVPRGEGLVIHNANTENAVFFGVLSDAAGAVDGAVHFWEP